MNRLKTEYRRDLQHSYLVLHVEAKMDEQAYPLKMVTQNHIRGLLECECRRIDDDILYYYDLTSRISLAEMCCARKITGEEIVLVVYRFLQALMNMEEYLLPGDSLCIKPEYIYMDARMQEVYFCYVPGETWNLEEEFRELMEGFLPFLDHRKQDDVVAVYGLYHYAVQESFSLEGLRQQLEIYRREEERKEETEEEKSQLEKESTKESVAELEAERQDALDAFFQDEEEEERKTHSAAVTFGTVIAFLYFLCGWFLWRNFIEMIWIWAGCGILAGAGMFFWYRMSKKNVQEISENYLPVRDIDRNQEWTDEKDDCATQILGRGREQTHYVLEEKYPEPGRQIILGEKEVQFIGQLQETADILLPSQAVSRIHARLRRSGDSYYLCDLNSRNGTWVNEQELHGDQEMELRVGDEIKFADLIYRLRQV